MGIQPAATFVNYMDTQQDRKYTYNVTSRRVPVTTYRRRTMNITYCQCVSVALDFQNAIRLSSVAFLALLYVSTLSHTQLDFRWKSH